MQRDLGELPAEATAPAQQCTARYANDTLQTYVDFIALEGSKVCGTCGKSGAKQPKQHLCWMSSRFSTKLWHLTCLLQRYVSLQPLGRCRSKVSVSGQLSVQELKVICTCGHYGHGSHVYTGVPTSGTVRWHHPDGKIACRCRLECFQTRGQSCV